MGVYTFINIWLLSVLLITNKQLHNFFAVLTGQYNLKHFSALWLAFSDKKNKAVIKGNYMNEDIRWPIKVFQSLLQTGQTKVLKLKGHVSTDCFYLMLQ